MFEESSKNFSFVPVNVLENKINAIKLIREFTEYAFGLTGAAGLKEAKDFIDTICTRVQATQGLRVRNAYRLALLSTPKPARAALYTEMVVAGNYVAGIPGINRYDLTDYTLSREII